MKSEYPLVDTSWLEAHLSDSGIRIFDATVFLSFPDGLDAPYVIESGRNNWEESHIPGAHFADLVDEISDTRAPTAFTMLPADEFCEKMSAFGVDDDSTVVVYSTTSVMWATRLWWMFRSVGFDRCYVLDGGLPKWNAEKRPVTDSPSKVIAAKGQLTPRPRPALWASKDEVMKAIGSNTVCTVNALAPEAYNGERNSYGRPGHIPGSINVFFNTLTDPDTGTFLPRDRLRQAMDEAGLLGKERVICYCGGGISATMDALALHVSGHPDVAIYDGSMKEWAADESAPLALGDEP